MTEGKRGRGLLSPDEEDYRQSNARSRDRIDEDEEAFFGRIEGACRSCRLEAQHQPGQHRGRVGSVTARPLRRRWPFPSSTISGPFGEDVKRDRSGLMTTETRRGGACPPDLM